MLSIETIVVTPFQQNARIVVETESGSAVIVDPGGDIPLIVEALDAVQAALPGVRWESIFLTHSHIDHAAGVPSLLEHFAARGMPAPRLYAHVLDKPLRQAIRSQALLFSLPPEEYRNCPEPDVALVDGDVFELGAARGTVLFTPGHAPGHLALFFPAGDATIAEGREVTSTSAPIVIAGDTLFYDSVGRTDLPFGDTDTLMQSIREKLFTLPPDTIVLTGHGPATTIRRERTQNPFFRA